MDDAPVVGELQRVAQRRHDGQRLFRREFSHAQELPQIHAVHKFHEQIIKTARLSEVVNGDDVGMVQGGQRLRLARETFGELRFPHALRCEEFQRHQAVQRLLPRLVNHAHAAAAQAFKDFLRPGLRRRHRLGHQAARAQPCRGG